jgi:hypothetical protein
MYTNAVRDHHCDIAFAIALLTVIEFSIALHCIVLDGCIACIIALHQ